MEDKYALITTLVAAIVLAFVFGFVASRIRLSPIVGYLLAGLAVGPHTPGFTGNTEFALQLSEVGVILLMFGVGLKISIEDIWSVRWIAVPGSVVHTLAAGALGYGAGLALGMPHVESFIRRIALDREHHRFLRCNRRQTRTQDRGGPDRYLLAAHRRLADRACDCRAAGDRWGDLH